jgi:hypothetical protein
MKTLILSIWMLLPNWEMKHEVMSVMECPTNEEVQKQFKRLEDSNQIVGWHAICQEVVAVPEISDKKL